MKGRKKTTGRFETRDELVEFICRKYYTTKLGDTAIGRMAQVSQTTVANILSGEEGKAWRANN